MEIAPGVYSEAPSFGGLQAAVNDAKLVNANDAPFFTVRDTALNNKSLHLGRF
jgi:hypothetical protein